VGPLEDTPAKETDRKFPLVEVVYGPGSRTGTVDIVKRALNHYGFDDVTVKQTDAPLMA